MHLLNKELIQIPLPVHKLIPGLVQHHPETVITHGPPQITPNQGLLQKAAQQARATPHQNQLPVTVNTDQVRHTTEVQAVALQEIHHPGRATVLLQEAAAVTEVVEAAGAVEAAIEVAEVQEVRVAAGVAVHQEVQEVHLLLPDAGDNECH